MLCLSRRENEKVRLRIPGVGNVWLTILGWRSGEVRLGFDAPPAVQILRGEIVRADAPPALKIPDSTQRTGG